MTHDTPPLTPAQTAGPFFHIGLIRDDVPLETLTTPETLGERIRIEGRVLDGDGQPVPDAVLEIWQANAFGRYHHPADGGDAPLDLAFTGYGRCATDDDGRYRFTTIRPGPVRFDATRMQAPHVSVSVFARGLLHHLLTRIYFADDPALTDDPILQLVPEARRATLLAAREERDGETIYHFDVRLQGEGETVFFDPRPAGRR